MDCSPNFSKENKLKIDCFIRFHEGGEGVILLEFLDGALLKPSSVVYLLKKDFLVKHILDEKGSLKCK